MWFNLYFLGKCFHVLIIGMEQLAVWCMAFFWTPFIYSFLVDLKLLSCFVSAQYHCRLWIARCIQARSLNCYILHINTSLEPPPFPPFFSTVRGVSSVLPSDVGVLFISLTVYGNEISWICCSFGHTLELFQLLNLLGIRWSNSQLCYWSLTFWWHYLFSEVGIVNNFEDGWVPKKWYFHVFHVWACFGKSMHVCLFLSQHLIACGWYN